MSLHSICFRVDADEQIGMGHFVRCLSLAKQAQKKGALISFLMGKTNQKVLDILTAQNIQINQLSDVFDLTPKSNLGPIVITDIFNNFTYQRKQKLLHYMVELSQQFRKFIYFDDADQDFLTDFFWI